MHSWQGRSRREGGHRCRAAQPRQSWWLWLVVPSLGLTAGCGAGRSQLDHALLADQTPAAHARQEAAVEYRIRCPDVLTIEVNGRPDCCGTFRVGADGRVTLGPSRLRVDGLTVPAVVRAVAEMTAVPPGQVRIRVAEFNSQVIYLIGEVNGRQRAVAYQGPETVLDLLQRAGGVAPGAALGEIQVVRAHVADGKSPEVFPVDLHAIVVKHDQHTNIHLQPFDQVYVGQSNRSRWRSCVPPWLRPLYETLCGMRRAGGSATVPPAGKAPQSAKLPDQPAQ
jgi:protein involved in polysaccharide export with SLBB domain